MRKLRFKSDFEICVRSLYDCSENVFLPYPSLLTLHKNSLKMSSVIPRILITTCFTIHFFRGSYNLHCVIVIRPWVLVTSDIKFQISFLQSKEHMGYVQFDCLSHFRIMHASFKPQFIQCRWPPLPELQVFVGHRKTLIITRYLNTALRVRPTF